MTVAVPLSQVTPRAQSEVGGKCIALARMHRRGVAVPDTLCVLAEAYRRYVGATGLRERILLELNRKDFGDMRWEELWDASLRIRNMFLTTPIPGDLSDELSSVLELRFGSESVVIRSSAPGEDSESVSFAGLHESFVNVRGSQAMLEHIRLVWASLWSDAALLYRRDLKLDVSESVMAVAVQELVNGDRSGVAFTRSPSDDRHAVIESVYGLNQGLVDGAVEPDRWIIDRETGDIVRHVPSPREGRMAAAADGVELESLPTHLSLRPPLADEEVRRVFDCARALEGIFGCPQDVEWTWATEGLIVLQSRPVTTESGKEGDDDRRWYLSLRRSFENLQSLRHRIEQELIPSMIESADDLAAQPVDALSNADLAGEIDQRRQIYDHWVDVYWEEFIPFAHGIRLFGQVYNDTLRPQDPYAFMDLLSGTDMASLARNRALARMASLIRQNGLLREALTSDRASEELAEDFSAFVDQMLSFVERFGDLSCAMTGSGQCEGPPNALIKILLEMANQPPQQVDPVQRDVDALEEEYLNRFSGRERDRAAELLDLARTSYKLRDDDNIYLGRVEAQLMVAIEEGRRRLLQRGMDRVEELGHDDVSLALRRPEYVPRTSRDEDGTESIKIRARQIVGQPAGPGVANGPARVITSQADLTSFRHGEVLVCDAVDPNMTFVVPLAAAVIERRGGMLIHGAIIAREYGLPCVTGIPHATELIRSGDSVTVDGYLGIVTIVAGAETPSGAKD